MKTFADRVIVVTGAGSGMGRSYAREFARRGAHLALNDYDAEALKGTLELLPAGTTVISEAYDVGDRAATEAFAARVADELGGAHVVINNAGVEGGARPVWSLDVETYERIMQINFWGVLYGTKAFLPQIQARGEGAIVNVSSIFGLTGSPSQSDYCATKFAVRGLTEALAVELIDSPIGVHLVHPGGIATNIARSENSKAFSEKYLTTDPDKVAVVVADAILKGKGRIVYGFGSGKTWLGARALPMNLMAKLVWRDVKPTLNQDDYPHLTGR